MSQRVWADNIIAYLTFVAGGRGERRLLALASEERLEFFSDYGVRS